MDEAKTIRIKERKKKTVLEPTTAPATTEPLAKKTRKPRATAKKEPLATTEPRATTPSPEVVEAIDQPATEVVATVDQQPVAVEATTRCVLSFDIGIVNLAYCLMEVGNPATPLRVIDWDVLDISGNAMCCLCTKRSSTYVVLNPSTTLYYCSSHTTNYAKKHYPSKEVHKITSLGTRSLDDLGAELYRRLESITSFRRKIDCVLFENQPAFKNPKMKSIQMILYSYFLLKRTLGDGAMSVGELRFYMAKRKLEIKGVGVDASLFDKKEYGDRKVLGKIIAKTILDKIGDRANLARLAEFKKQDDMCDCFIQGVEYLQSTGTTMF